MKRGGRAACRPKNPWILEQVQIKGQTPDVFILFNTVSLVLAKVFLLCLPSVLSIMSRCRKSPLDTKASIRHAALTGLFYTRVAGLP